MVLQRIKCHEMVLQRIKCHLSQKHKESLCHMLCGYKVTLNLGRQTERHGSILLEIHTSMRTLRNRELALQNEELKRAREKSVT